MNLKDFKEWLNQFPDDTVVETISVSGGYNETDVYFIAFNPDEHSLYFRSQHESQKSFLQLGSV